MAVEFTQNQQRAVDSRGCSLILSAAAGSGKTAVLVERVIGLISDPAEGCDIDKLVVVTFTKAAAAEMRGKISTALLKKIASQPGNIRLRRQLSLLSGARIQTVHSFCLDLVRENFAVCGVPADFTTADDAVAGELRKQALDEALEELYVEGEEDFKNLCAVMAGEKGDGALVTVITEIYDKLTSHVDPIGDLERFTSPEGQSLWKESLMSEAYLKLAHCTDRMEKTVARFEDIDEVNAKYGPAFRDCIDFGRSMLEKIGARDWDGSYALISSFVNPRLTTVRGEEYKVVTDLAKSVKEDFKKVVDRLNRDIFTGDEASMAFGREINLSALMGLRLAVGRYSERYSQLKLRRKLLDFSDLEHLAYSLLRDEKGGLTPLGQEISEGIFELLVDEYQDTNDIQEAIFAALSSRAQSSFFVGDVKQSIYRFRMAKPEIFSNKYDAYLPFEDGARGKNMRLPLNRNFRSRREILEVCNRIFGAVMSRDFGEVDYNEEEALHSGAPYEGEGKVKLALIDMQGSADEEDSPEKAEAEAIYTANAIADMVGKELVSDPFAGTSRPARYGDFAILLSSFSNKAQYFIRELERLGIPVSGGQKDFWNSMEILTVVSMLRVLDNRRQDIPLIGLMRSPFFMFTPDELAEIRLADRRGSFFDAAVAHAASGNGKTADFLSLIDRYVAYVPNSSPSQIIGMIYSELSAAAVFSVMEGGESRVSNLNAFYNMALEYEGSGHRSLYDFIRYIEGKMEHGSAPQTEEEDGVRIMSIHKSKGLEFPIVFLPDLNKAFNYDDVKSRVVMHDRLGIGMKIRMTETKAQYVMPMYRAVSLAVKRELASEEVRKLYVAMTRAREKLILVAGLSNADKMIDDIANDMLITDITPGWLSEKNNWAAWIMAALMKNPCECIETERLSYHSIERRGGARGQSDNKKTGQVRAEMLESLARSAEPYAHGDISALPSKLTPAGTKRLLEDSGIINSRDGKSFVEIYRRSAEDGALLTAARRGSAIHLVLSSVAPECWGDIEKIKETVERMASSGIMSQEEAAAADAVMMASFGASRWGRESADKEIFREYEFSALMTPAELGLNGGEDEHILMNGVIDLLMMDKDGITVIDFKTDNIKTGTEGRAALRHKLQLDIYALAAQKIFERPVKEKVVFFLRTGRGAVL